MELIDRNYSIITGKHNLEELCVLKHFPVFFGCVDTDPQDDIFADMHWCIDPETGVIQLSKLIPIDILYQEQHVDGCGPTWEAYYRHFAEYISAYDLGYVLEIGGGQGRLAEVVTRLTDTFWTIVEPNPTYAGSTRIQVLRSFVDEKFQYKGRVDTVVFSQVLEHAYDPQAFLTAINILLPLDGKLIFAYPNLELWLRRKYTNALNFEHTMFLTDYHVDYLLTKNGFEIKNKTPYQDHSIFYVAEKKGSSKQIPLPPSKLVPYQIIFNDFIEYHSKTVKELNELILAADEPVYIFGAHIFTQYLLGFGLLQEKVQSILDNSKTKQGRRLYGTRFRVESPRVLRDKQTAKVILKAGIYNNEIKEDILSNINPNVVFWE